MKLREFNLYVNVEHIRMFRLFTMIQSSSSLFWKINCSLEDWTTQGGNNSANAIECADKTANVCECECAVVGEFLRMPSNIQRICGHSQYSYRNGIWTFGLHSTEVRMNANTANTEIPLGTMSVNIINSSTFEGTEVVWPYWKIYKKPMSSRKNRWCVFGMTYTIFNPKNQPNCRSNVISLFNIFFLYIFSSPWHVVIKILFTLLIFDWVWDLSKFFPKRDFIWKT